MDNPLISVIIIFYNAGNHLQEAVQSILGQTYKNWELFLVDDGSSDSSTLSAKKFTEEFPNKIFYLEHEYHVNKGMSTSRNLGIKFSKGKYITFLDADDVYLRNKLEEQLEIFDKYPNISCIFGATILWFTWDSSQAKIDLIHTLRIPSIVYQPGELFKLLLNQKAEIPSICTLMVRQDLVNLVGGFEEKFTGMFEDLVFYSKIAIEAVNFVDNKFYTLYRQHNDSYQKSISDETILQYRIKYLCWLLEYVLSKKIKDKEILNILKKQIWLSKHPAVNYFHRRILKQIKKIRIINKFRLFYAK